MPDQTGAHRSLVRKETVMNEMRKLMKEKVAILLAVEVLDHYDKSFLITNRKELSKSKRKILRSMADILERFELDDADRTDDQRADP